MKIYDSKQLQKISIEALTEKETGKYCGYILTVHGATVKCVIEPAGDYLLLAEKLGLDPNAEKVEGRASGSGYDRGAFALSDFLKRNSNNTGKEDLNKLQAGGRNVAEFLLSRGLVSYSII